jgi:hypothetical protein
MFLIYFFINSSDQMENGNSLKKNILTLDMPGYCI